MRKNFYRQLLASTPSNQKRSQYRAVILVVGDTTNSTLGLCVNRPDPDDCDCDCGCCLPLYLGGPNAIDERYFFLHDNSKLGRKKDRLFGGVYLSPPERSDKLRELPTEEWGLHRMITGFCEWNPGELLDEVTKGWWLVCDPDHELVLKREPTELWEELVPHHYTLTFSEN